MRHLWTTFLRKFARCSPNPEPSPSSLKPVSSQAATSLPPVASATLIDGFAIAMDVKFKSGTVDEFVEDHAADVSPTGIFIVSRSGLPAPHEIVKLRVTTARDEPVLVGLGRVLWHSPNGGQLPPGFGLRLIKLEEGTDEILGRMLADQRRRNLTSRFELGGGDPRPPEVPSEVPNARGMELVLELTLDGKVALTRTLLLSSARKESVFETKAGTVKLTHQFGQPTSSLGIETRSARTALAIPVHRSVDWEHLDLPPNGRMRLKVKPLD